MKIPVNIITGFLGVGKTTAVKYLLSQKPETENWAIIINEFGAVAIDHTLIEEDKGLIIKEIAGGCICCTSNLPMQTVLTTLLRKQKPDRILIEPTGMGHPAGIIDLLQNQYLKNILEIRATICLVDARKWASEHIRSHETFQDQINLADIILVNKTDLAENSLVERFIEWAKGLFPPKILVLPITQAEIPIVYLDIVNLNYNNPLFPNAHTHHHIHSSEEIIEVPRLGNPVKKLLKGFGVYTCGWIFSNEEIFDLAKLKLFFEKAQGLSRAKGVFRIGKEWIFINAVGNEYSLQYIAYRKDSRIELIADYDLDWLVFEVQLKDCILP